MSTVSVCLAAYNGGRHIEEQLRSILASSCVNEVIVSDDGSTDETWQVVSKISDPRVLLVHGPRKGLIKNFESLLQRASGDVIFLADQDDVWMPNKVDMTLEALLSADLVVTDCAVVDAALNVLVPSFRMARGSGPGLLKNLMRNGYLGCCMAFKRSLLTKVLPFPAGVPMHDWWIGIAAERTSTVRFLNVPLVLYRRHGANASPTSQRSPYGRMQQLNWRSRLLLATLKRHGLWARRPKA